MSKVIVGMSGGVDSAVAAYLLKEEGYEVIGLTLRTWEAEDGIESRCCEIDDARSTAFKLGIRYHTLNCLSCFQENVIRPFIHDYMEGRTPNPCIECNRYVKWDRMLYMAKVLGAEYIATGHYASVVRCDNGRYTVKKALHAQKDQTYMLYKLSQDQLKATLMPLGKLSKKEVRQIAEDIGLSVASKPDSQEICFVPEGTYTDFIEKNAGTDLSQEGYFVDESGRKLGKHKGVFHYTVGQRKGLGIALGYPAYVREIRPDENEVVLVEESSLYQKRILCRNVNFLSIPAPERGQSLPCLVKIRYHHQGEKAVIETDDEGNVEVTFDRPVKAPAPGQSAVFYDEEGCVIGGGIIAKNGSPPE